MHVIHSNHPVTYLTRMVSLEQQAVSRNIALIAVSIDNVDPPRYILFQYVHPHPTDDFLIID